MFIISDIAGQLDALERLVKQFPADEQIVLVGDLVDRGHQSAEVVDWAMKNSRVISLKGNHEHMMIDYWDKTKIYHPGIWEVNGGTATLLSYERLYGSQRPPEKHLEWLRSRPLFFKTEDKSLLVTHAPLHADISLEQALIIDDNVLDFGILWNRTKPKKRNYFQVFGHNSHWGLMPFGDEDGAWGICIDQSRKQVITAFHWPTGEILEEPYLQNKELGL